MAATLSPTDSPTWYIATDMRGRVLTNLQPFVRVKEVGQHLLTSNPRGFLVYADPLDVRRVERARDQAEWQVWRVELPGGVAYGSNPFKWRPYSLRVVEQMPAGFEFGTFGQRVGDFVAHVGSLREWPDQGAYLEGFGADDVDAADAVQYQVEGLALTRIRLHLFHRRADRSNVVQQAATLIHRSELGNLARLVIAGRALPEDSVRRWSIPDHLAAAAIPPLVDVPRIG